MKKMLSKKQRRITANLFVVLIILFFFSLKGYCQSLTPESNTQKILPKDIHYNILSNQFLERKLDNGIKLIVNENPGSGLVAAEFLFKVGNMEQMDTHAGITMVIQNLLLKNKVSKSKETLQNLLEYEGCLVFSDVEPDYARISLLCTRDIFNKNFLRIVKVIKNPVFEEDTLKEVKGDLLFKMSNQRSAYSVINDMFIKEFYRYHPYRQPILGYKNTIQRLKAKEVKRFYDKYYCANRLTVAISGDINGSDILKVAKTSLKDIPKKVIDKVDIPWEPISQEKKLYLVTSSNTAWLFVGFPAPDVKSPDYPKMLMLSTLMGKGLSSRLFIELREKEGLAYELSANYPGLEGPSYMVMYILTNSKNLYKCRKKFFSEIRKIKQELILDEELEATRRKVLGKLLMSKEGNCQRAFSAAYYSSLGLGSNYDESLIEKINRVTAQDIKYAARKYLENYTVLVIQSSPKYWKVRGRRRRRPRF